MRVRKSDKLWENYCRIVQVMDRTIDINNSKRRKLNRTAWKLIEKYIEALTKEFLQ